ncbi:putative RNA polymerase 147 kDa subunit [Yalta virus]|nr:putative RNA polymerase 147 kDa subunit [Yalta virus]
MGDKHIQFSIYPQEYVDSTNIEIETGLGIEQSVKSLALGSISFGQPCTTCNLTDKCPGHTGKFKIQTPIFKSSFKKPIEFLLKCVCPICGHIRFQDINDLLSDIEANNNVITLKHRREFNNIMNNHKSYDKQIKTRCCKPFCNVATSSIQYTKNNSFTFNSDSKQICDNQKLYTSFVNLPDNFKRLLCHNAEGVFKPEDVFYNNFILIPSNYTRPPNIYADSVNEPFTSDLNGLVRSHPKKMQKTFDMIDSNQKANPYSSGHKLSLAILTNGTAKDSYLRNYINGKRVPGTGRAVIGPGIDLKIGEVDVPNYILNGLTDQIFFNKVTKNFILSELQKPNHERLFKFTDFIKEDQSNPEPFKIISLKENHKVVAPNFGDRFEYPKQENQYIMFGRQPSLHKFNLQASKIKKDKLISLPDGRERTLNINISTTASFNADFDGDENTMKTFANTTSNIELGLIMNSRCLLKHPLTGTTVFGFVQDQIVATNLLLQEKNITRKKAMQILGEYSFLLFESGNKKDILSGREIMSLIFPDHYTLLGVVEDGNVIVDKIVTNMVSANSYNSIFNGISQYYGSEYTLEIIDMFKKVIQNYLKYFGLSVKLSDIIPDPYLLTEVKLFTQEYIKKINEQINNVIRDINNETLYVLSNDEMIDFKMKNIDVLTKKTQKYIIDEILPKYYNDDNNQFKKCYDMKYKLNDKDLVTLLGFVGQQKGNKGMPTPNINGKSILFGRKNDISLEATGFISNPLMSGLTYNQYVSVIKHESLPQIVDVTSGTAQAGYIGKKIVKNASELIVNYDRFLVSNKHIINFNTNFLKISMEDTARVKIYLPNKNMIWYDFILTFFNTNIKNYMIQKLGSTITIIEEVDFFVNIYSEIMTYYYTNKDKKTIKTDPNILKQKILDFYCLISKKYFFDLNDLSYILYILLIYFDPSAYVLNKPDENISIWLTEELLDIVFDKIIFKLKYSLSPGTMLGYEIANTIQERFTQQSLSSFHATTKAGSNVEKGSMEAFKQLVELSKKDKEDVTTIHSYNYKSLEIIKNNFEYISLKNICSNIEILEENAKKQTVVYRADISIPLLINKKISLTTVYNMFKTYCNRCFCIIDYFLHQQISEDKKILYVYIFTKLSYNSKNYQETFDLIKHYFKVSFWDGVHKGKQINTSLSIDEIKINNFDDEGKIVSKKMYELKFFVESLNDFENIRTADLEYIDLPPWLSYSVGGIQYMKNNTIGKAYAVINDSYFTNAIKQFFDFRFALSKPLNMKSLYNKEEIIKLSNHGAGNNFIHNVSYNNKVDKCDDIYSSLLVSQKPHLGTNYYDFFVNPNVFDKLALMVKNTVHEIDDEQQIVSMF